MNLVRDFKYARQFFWQRNLPILVFLIIILLMGVVFGALAISSLDYPVKNDLANYIVAFIDGFDEELRWQGQNRIGSSLVYQGQILVLIWLFGFTIIGLPFIPLIVFLRGFIMGFTVAFLVEELKMQGFLFAMASLLPQNIILIPAYLLVAMVAIAFSWNLVNSLLNRRAIDFWQQFIGYSFLIACLGVGFFVAGLLEYYVTPHLMDLAANLILRN